MLSELGLNDRDTEMRAEVERQLMDDRASLQTLLKHYGEAHPRVQELTETVRSAEAYLNNYAQLTQQRQSAADDERLGPMLIGMVEERLASLWEHECKLGREYRQAEEQAVQLNDRMAELRLAGHDLERLRTLHDTLLNRMNSIDVGKDRADVRATVVSEPSASDRPVSPKLPLTAVMFLLAGLGVGVTLVYVLDVPDDRFRSPEELQRQLGAPVLAMVRELPALSTNGAEALQVHVAPESVESEAFRTLRTTLAFSGQEMERIAVTSTEPGDGKTTVLANLGVSYAHAGTRSLLIDCDLRRPGLTKMFEMRGHGGVSEILRGENDVAAMCAQRVQPTSIDGLDIIPCGPKPSNPAELSSGSRRSDLLAWAEAKYDQVLVDCPPILAASDAVIVGRLTDSLILVVQPEKNHRRLVLRTVNGLAAVGLGVGGIVANRIRAEKNGGYYGYGGYGYGYGYGGADEEQVDEATFPVPNKGIDLAEETPTPTRGTQPGDDSPRRVA
jgi:capsular exopolysaccharide synthesis family protein